MNARRRVVQVELLAGFYSLEVSFGAGCLSQIGTVAELDEDESVTDSQKRHGRVESLCGSLLSRKKILNELSSDSRAEEEEEEEVPVSSAASASVPTSIYQTSSGQYTATGDIPAYQLRSPNSGLAHSIVMAASPGTMQNPPQHHSEDITRKREVRLMKNRKKKEYVKCLEKRVGRVGETRTRP
uniref:BZIP domain-containing protein n=1 Tax=Gasterosteus aculeatus aculeatus TaxID=481459 RepID=A0AAQ4QAE4_GASAC